MKRMAMLISVFTTAIVIVLPFVGGSGPSLASVLSSPGTVSAAATQVVVHAAAAPAVRTVSAVTAIAPTDPAALRADSEHLAQKPVPKPQPPVSRSGAASGTSERRAAVAAAGLSCPGTIGGAPGGAPGRVSAGGVAGTTSGDLASFAAQFNAIRVANCLWPIPLANFRYDSCMEDRLFWMAEDPSTDPASAWGHIGSVRSDGLPSYGCDGNLAGGSGNTGATVAQKWWDSTAHRTSLYKPSSTGNTAGICIGFAMTHGGLPNESSNFTRAAARWGGC